MSPKDINNKWLGVNDARSLSPEANIELELGVAHTLIQKIESILGLTPQQETKVKKRVFDIKCEGKSSTLLGTVTITSTFSDQENAELELSIATSQNLSIISEPEIRTQRTLWEHPSINEAKPDYWEKGSPNAVYATQLVEYFFAQLNVDPQAKLSITAYEGTEEAFKSKETLTLSKKGSERSYISY